MIMKPHSGRHDGFSKFGSTRAGAISTGPPLQKHPPSRPTPKPAPATSPVSGDQVRKKTVFNQSGSKLVMKKFHTHIDSVRGHHLHVRCGCGHFTDIPLSNIPVPPATRIADLFVRLRCAQCRSQNIVDVRLVWKGQGFEAQQGSRTREADGFRIEDITGVVK